MKFSVSVLAAPTSTLLVAAQGQSEVIGACGVPLPADKSRNAKILPLKCGEGAEGRTRFAEIVKPEIMDEWETLSRSGLSSAQEEMQKIRLTNLKYTGTIEVPIIESWTYTQAVTGTDANRCGTSQVASTCYEPIYENYETTETEQYCAEYYTPPEPSYDSGSSSSSGSSYDSSSSGSSYGGSSSSSSSGYGSSSSSSSGSSYGGSSSSSGSSYGDSSSSSSNSGSYGGSSSSSSGWGSGSAGNSYDSSSSSGSSGYNTGSYGSSSSSSSSSSSKGSGESSSEISDSLDDRFTKKSNGKRSNRPQSCVRYSSRQVTVTRQRQVGSRPYTCYQTVPNTCTWDETHTGTRKCKNIPVKYTVSYQQDPKWKPGYVDAKKLYRSYSDILPNKYDLLPGESEDLYIYANAGQSQDLKPRMVLRNNWNEYKVDIVPKTLACSATAKPSVEFKVYTVGRVKKKAPNPLALPVDDKGNPVEPVVFETSPEQKTAKLVGAKPIEIRLQDKMRATSLAAARLSRTFPRPEGVEKASEGNSIYKFFFGKDKPATALDNGFWAESQFRVQLFRQDRRKRWVRVSRPIKFSNNSADLLGDSINISLIGGENVPSLYRPIGGVLEPILGGLNKAFGVEFTPGREYIIKVQVAQKGLPFYISGCRSGNDVCEGEEPKEMAYSDPLLVKFTSDKSVDNRSWFKKLKDWQEKFLIL